MIENFQDGTVSGKVQIGSAWWFNDQNHGIERQLDNNAVNYFDFKSL